MVFRIEEGDDREEIDRKINNYHARRLEIIDELEARIPTLHIEQLGGICPFQSEGSIGEYKYYFRERGGYASLKLDKVDPISFEIDWLASEEVREFLDLEEFPELFIKFLKNLERAPFRYIFKGFHVKVESNPDGDPILTETDVEEEYVGYSLNIEDAFNEFKEYWETSPYMLGNGWSEQSLKELFQKMRVDPNPINRDERVMDEEPPVFEILDRIVYTLE